MGRLEEHFACCRIGRHIERPHPTHGFEARVAGTLLNDHPVVCDLEDHGMIPLETVSRIIAGNAAVFTQGTLVKPQPGSGEWPRGCL